VTTAVPPPHIRVPFLDLAPMHAALKDAILAEIAEVVDAGAFSNGRQVGEFETAFADYCRTEHCIGVASGLDALRLALQASEIEPGDEVVLPANTFVATAEAVTQAGGIPVLADVTETDYNVDTDAVEAAITQRTRFLLPVHLYGQMADMHALRRLAVRHDLTILEDACQAHGAERQGLRAGAAGDAAAFSFYPGKNLGAFGDAGALVTNSAELRDRVRALREHGQAAKYHHDWIGWTSRLDTVQGVVLSHKLPHLDSWNRQRRAIADTYLERLAGVGDLLLPRVAPSSDPVWHLFVLRTAVPAELAEHLQSRGIGTGRHYPEPIHLTQAYNSLGLAAGAFPVTERLARECLSLPVFPGMTTQQVDAVVHTVTEYFDNGAR
jgi:dTDP-4-amino-4,6-dideoxygalactose transaminase